MESFNTKEKNGHYCPIAIAFARLVDIIIEHKSEN